MRGPCNAEGEDVGQQEVSFVGDGWLAYSNNVPPRGDLAQDLLGWLEGEPVPPALLGDERLEQGAEEQQRGQEQGAQGLGQPRGPVAQGVEGGAEAVAARAREDGEGGQGGGGAGEGDGGDARADDLRRVPAEGGRGPGLWGEVEGDHVEEGVEDLRGGLAWVR